MKFKVVISIFLLSLLAQRCGTSESKEMKLDLKNEAGNNYTCTFNRYTTTNFLEFSNVDTTLLQINIKVLPPEDTLNMLEIRFIKLQRNSSRPKAAAIKPGFRERIARNIQMELEQKMDSTYEALRGKVIKVGLSKRGRVEKVNGMDELIDTLASEVRTNKSFINSWINDYAGENAIKDQLNRLFSVVPNKKLAPGDNWGADITLVAKAPIHVNTLYTLKSFTGDSATVEIQSKILGGTQGNFYLNGNESGFTIVNINSGLPYLYETRSNSVTKTQEYEIHETQHWIILLQKIPTAIN